MSNKPKIKSPAWKPLPEKIFLTMKDGIYFVKKDHHKLPPIYFFGKKSNDELFMLLKKDGDDFILYAGNEVGLQQCKGGVLLGNFDEKKKINFHVKAFFFNEKRIVLIIPPHRSGKYFCADDANPEPTPLTSVKHGFHII